MKVLILGLGSIGMRHARNLASMADDNAIQTLVGMVPGEERRTRFEAELQGDTFASLEEALASDSFDLAVIASPNVFHVSQAQVLAQAGCHLFIEKPLGISLDGVQDLIQVIEEKNIFAHVGSNWKFHPSFLRMKALLNEGVCGRVTGVQVIAGQWLPDWHPWEDYRQGYSARSDLGGGIVMDMHELDYMSWLLGDISDISGYTNRSGALDIDTEDVASMCLRFESGVLGTLHVDYIQRSYRRYYHISGDEGTLEWDIRTGKLRVYSAKGESEVYENVSEDINLMYIAQMQHIFDGVKGKVLPVTPVHHSATVLKLQMRLKQNG